MEQLFDLETWRAYAEQLLDQVESAAGDWRFLAQIVVLAALVAGARLVAKWVAPRLASWRERARNRYLRLLLDLVEQQLFALVLFMLAWIAVGILARLPDPLPSKLIEILASLLSAWLVIRFSSRLIRNATLARAVAWLAWSLAALDILNLLEPALGLLDSVGLNFGELRVSLLTLAKGALYLTLLIWLAALVSGLVERRIEAAVALTPSVKVLLSKLAKFGLITFAVLLGLRAVGIDLTAFAVFSGAVGVGVGFGLQKVVSNLMSGLILLLDRSIKPGDVIEIEGTFGWITQLNARYVSVVTRDGKEYLIPNEDLITQRVINWSYTDQLVRLEIEFGVSYDSDPHRVRELAVEATKSVERVSAEKPPVCHLAKFGDSSLDFILRFWIRDPREGVQNVKGRVLLALWDTFKAEGIEIPYPHREIIWKGPLPAGPRPAEG